MDSKAMMWLIITIVSTIFAWIGTFFGGGWFGLWSNLLGVIGCFVGIWFWWKFVRTL